MAARGDGRCVNRNRQKMKSALPNLARYNLGDWQRNPKLCAAGFRLYIDCTIVVAHQAPDDIEAESGGLA